MNIIQKISSKSMCCLSYPKRTNISTGLQWDHKYFRGSGTVPAICCVLRQEKKQNEENGDASGGIREPMEQILGEANDSQDWCPSLGLQPLYSGRIELALDALHHWKGDSIFSSTKCSLGTFLLTNCEPAQSNGKGTKEGSETLHFTHL